MIITLSVQWWPLISWLHFINGSLCALMRHLLFRFSPSHRGQSPVKCLESSKSVGRFPAQLEFSGCRHCEAVHLVVPVVLGFSSICGRTMESQKLEATGIHPVWQDRCILRRAKNTLVTVRHGCVTTDWSSQVCLRTTIIFRLFSAPDYRPHQQYFKEKKTFFIHCVWTWI